MGIQEKLRLTDKALNAAFTAKTQAEKAIHENQEPANTTDLVQALRDADEAISEKEIALHRL